ncbi:transcription termination/antitermination protein NusG [Candidatus Legionella polyplacis]|uniref:transcription termination/antitermination protein NusG n=1 Tax=Candidatus Legionella polyplacis TaxID=2005262 RepID=UPI003BAE5737
MVKNSENIKKWYVVHVYSGFERLVMREIKSKIKQFCLEDKISNVVVPSEEVVEMRFGKKRRSTRKFFPGYVLVYMIMEDETRNVIREIPRVLGFIGGTRNSRVGIEKWPTPISDKEVEVVLQRIEDGVSKPKPKVLFESGELIRIKDGPFIDFNGVVEEVNYEKSRLRVAVLIFGRSTPVDLEFSQVEKT